MTRREKYLRQIAELYHDKGSTEADVLGAQRQIIGDPDLSIGDKGLLVGMLGDHHAVSDGSNAHHISWLGLQIEEYPSYPTRQEMEAIWTELEERTANGSRC